MRWDFFIFIFSQLAIMVTNTAFRKSRLGKLILQKIFPGTSKNWPYHTDLLVFCPKFKISLVCEYLNFFFLKKTSWISEVCEFTLGNSGQNKAFFILGNSVKL